MNKEVFDEADKRAGVNVVERDRKIVKMFRLGKTVEELADEFVLLPKHIEYILEKNNS